MTQICQKITGNKIKIGKEIENRPADLRAFISDNTKIETEIGWSPQHTVEDVFSDVYSWITENEVMLKPLLT